MITIKNRKLIIPKEDRVIGTVSDNNSETRIFVIDRYLANGIDLAALTFGMDMEYEDGTTRNATYLTKEVTDEIINLTWGIVEGDVQKSGTMFVQITAMDYDGTVKWATIRDAFYVEPVIGTAEEYTGDLSAFQRMEVVLDQKLEQIEGFLEDIDDIEEAEAGRVEAENGRVSAEEQRVLDEGARDTAEGLRASAETGRTTAEGLRVSAETGRVNAEGLRVSAETGRVNAEADRVLAEKDRADAEEIREANEETRQETLGDLQDAIDACNAASTTQALKAEGFAVGTQEGVPVVSPSPYFEMNAKFLRELVEKMGFGTLYGSPLPDGDPYKNFNVKKFYDDAEQIIEGSAVLYVVQSLTDAQKAQARTNIAAMSAADGTALSAQLQSLAEVVKEFDSTVDEEFDPEDEHHYFAHAHSEGDLFWLTEGNELYLATAKDDVSLGDEATSSNLETLTLIDMFEALVTTVSGKGDSLQLVGDRLSLMSGSTELSYVTLAPGGSTMVEIPVPKSKSYTYNGQEQTFEWDTLDSTHITVSNNVNINAGTYSVIATLKNPADFWRELDGTISTDPKTFTWTIAKATGDFTLSADTVSALMTAADPTVNVSNIIGDGIISVSSSAVGVVNPSYNAGVITLTKVSAGTATVTVSLAATTNYTAQTKTIAVTLTKANQTFDLSANSVSLTSASPTASVNISNATGDGAFSVSSSDTGVATASVSGNVVSIAGVASGSATITVTKAATTNYNSLSKTIAVSAVLSVPTTFAVKSAINDTITITDGVDSVTATTGSNGSGNVTLDLGTTAKNYTFTSSVTGYSTTVGLTSSTTEVKVYPDSAAVWYLNSDLKNASSWEVKWHQSSSTQSITDNTTDRTVQLANTYSVGASAGFVSKQKIDVTNYTKMHSRLSMIKSVSGNEAGCFMAWGLVGDNWSSGYPSGAGGKSQDGLGYNVTGTNPVPMQDRELDISTLTGEWRLAIDISTGDATTTVKIEKIWFT